MKSMEVSVINIGNSKGIRLSKSLIKQYSIGSKVDLVLEKNRIIITPIQKPREGWEESFKIMHENGDDELLCDDIFEDENFEEWN